MVKFKVNGKEVQYDPAKNQGRLLEFIREDLHLTGTKCGCEEKGCGACTVLINGEAKRSCMFNCEKMEGAEVTTIEGVAEDHPMIQAMIEYNAVQCGFCTPGIVMAAIGLLGKNPNPSEAEIMKALRINLCRCGTYPRVVGAVLKAAAVMRGDKDVPHYVLEDHSVGDSFIGKSMPRVDAIDKITGKTKFYADYQFENTLYGKAVYAPVPHGILKSVDTSEAERMEGVAFVLTAKDIPEGGRNRFGVLTNDQPVFVTDHIRCISEYIAVVFAETQAIADEAAKLVKLDIEELPGVFSIEDALKPDAPIIPDPNNDKSIFGYMNGEKGNICKEYFMHRGDWNKAFAESDKIVDVHMETKRSEHGWIEPDGCQSFIDEQGRLAIIAPNQSPFADRDQIAKIVNIPSQDIHMIHVPCGGAFGGKTELTTHAYVCIATLKSGRPARMVNTRSDSIRTHPKRHGYTMDYKLGFEKTGKLKAMDIKIIADGGAYQSWTPRVLEQGLSYCSGPYYCPNFDMKCTGIYTNNMIMGAYRGFGAIQSHFGSECAFDVAATELGIDPIELRLMNAVERGLPMSTGQMLTDKSGVEYKKTLYQAKELVENKLKPMVEQLRAEGKIAGIGVASGWRSVAGGLGPVENAGADFELMPNGRVEFRIAATEMGQGSHTSLAQMASEITGVDWQDYDIIAGDTTRVPFGGGVMASRGTYLWGFPTITAGEEFKEKILKEVESAFGVSAEGLDIKKSVVIDKDGNRITDLKELAEKGVHVNVRVDYQLPDSHPVVENTNEDHKIPDEEYRVHHTVAYATLCTVVVVDPDTGKVHVRYMGQCTDAGRLINPDNVKQQLEGGLIMATSYALDEDFAIENGFPVRNTLGKNKYTRFDNYADEIETLFCDIDDPTGPFGAKGCAEICVLSVAPALANAVHDACGYRITELPINMHQEEIKEAAQKKLAEMKK